MNEKYLRFFSLTFFVLGVAFLLNSKIDITGAVIGVSVSSGFSSILGIVLILVSVMVFAGGKTLIDVINDITGVSEMDSSSRKKIQEDYKSEGHYRTSQKNFKEYEKKYHSISRPNEDNEWVTLYHGYNAILRGKEKTPKTLLRANKTLYLHDNPLNCVDELGLAPSQVDILKIKIAKSVYDDLKIKRRASQLSFEDKGDPKSMYILPGKKMKLADYLHHSGFIQIGRGK